MHRPVLIFGTLIILLLIIYTPSRVLYVEVKGNNAVPSNMILEKAAASGVYFGASRKLVRSERVKNQLIGQIPELQWVGINTDGCVATIQVAEKNPEVEEAKERGISSIVASRDGIVLSCTVFQGTPICKPGQAVKYGEILVSGYTDCGICVQATRANAEVLAQTRRSLTAVTPLKTFRRGNLLSQRTEYSIRIGKKLINFRKGSGIPDATCVKMYEEKQLVLPGGFVLPLSLIVKHYYNYEVTSAESLDSSWLEDYAGRYLKTQMMSGEILHQETQLQCADSVACFTGVYDCTEYIGQTKQEEIIDNYGYD